MRTDELLNAREVAARLGVGVRKVQRLFQSGQIEAQKLPGDTGAYVTTESAVTAYEHAQEKATS